mmetsp:Transcript_292/g.673  ORF Transcript_292/g.673 Transcript_292/m.673 type:complete len:214 (+) Transcript_292:2109-2750(+)
MISCWSWRIVDIIDSLLSIRFFIIVILTITTDIFTPEEHSKPLISIFGKHVTDVFVVVSASSCFIHDIHAIIQTTILRFLFIVVIITPTAAVTIPSTKLTPPKCFKYRINRHPASTVSSKTFSSFFLCNTRCFIFGTPKIVSVVCITFVSIDAIVVVRRDVFNTLNGWVAIIFTTSIAVLIFMMMGFISTTPLIIALILHIFLHDLCFDAGRC